MPEYIEQEAAICIVEHAEDEHPYKVPQVPETYSDYNQGWSDACVYIREKLEGSKATDVNPVRHGRWLFDDFDGDGLDYQCSACKLYTHSGYSYCPNCGTKMDG